MALCVPTSSLPEDTFYKNATHDELVYVHDGEGRLETVLGTVEFRSGDYVHVPRTLTHRWEFDSDVQPRLLVIESPTDFRPPKRYRNDMGQLLEHSPYCERDFRPPSELTTIDRHKLRGRGAGDGHPRRILQAQGLQPFLCRADRQDCRKAHGKHKHQRSRFDRTNH